MTSLEVDSTFKCYPMELARSIIPATGDDFGKALRAMIAGNPMLQPDAAAETFFRSYLDLKAIAARIKFVPVGGFTKSR